ncbi:Translational activator of cytochrome c oxidase 1 [Larimichthys crocea]|uniref:Translational activator of cytochrome c oxidase 1 n=2 Tax=Larimichthys crocea TaxID=215358 RepID=A0A6G0HYR5_LARCR|nr:Translational activator of cytochrome c oxidase 1 [Larimichthys crocea]
MMKQKGTETQHKLGPTFDVITTRKCWSHNKDGSCVLPELIRLRGMAGPVVLRALQTLRPQCLTATSGRFPAPVESVLRPASCVGTPLEEEHSCQLVAHVLCLMCRTQQVVKEGGSNPDMNLNLAHILEQCRSKNMPKVSIEAAIKSARCNSVLVHRGMLSDGARHNFNKRGVVLVPGKNVSTERALELAIEAGAADVQETEDEEEQPVLQFICDMMDLKKVRASLEELGVQITSAGLEFVPRTFLSLDEGQLDAASALIEALNDYPDVVRVWDNIQADS